MNVIFNDESNSVLNGIYTLADAVVSTLGPRGRNAIIMKDGVVHITKDGVTVANSINSKDPLEQVGISLISQAANKAVSLTGDGTTTSILLARTLIEQGLSCIHDFSNINVYDIKQGMRLYLDNVIAQLRSNAKQATTEQDLNNQDWKNKGIEATSTNMDSREAEQQFLTHILRIVLAQGREAKRR